MTNTADIENHTLQAAAAFADKNTPGTGDPSYDYKIWMDSRDTYLLYTGVGVFQLIKEMSERLDVVPPYALDYAYTLLVLIHKEISGMTGGFVSNLVGAGVASSENEALMYIFQAK